MRFLLDRLAEPGTLRSLAVMVFALKGIAPDQGAIQGFVDISILLLGGISAIMPAQKGSRE
ncbi:hypothetical protein [Roseomonas marmotae]|uniref:Uncharacterized protein n=1 Tax=Roseomonas marmotae TaxID=2768161 RepID=A0ABS3KBM9_9PROT|nr:hypothetical protein [Roseomonas marmotae]MBO1074876.1 hypothetical protein [Roseomonas marmotae]QTI80621.1 hypothetical protein IAI58_07805 [Roseomonas marmotae]